MEIVEKYQFNLISPVVVAVADINPEAVGYLRAKAQDIFVTTDYNTLFSRNDIDLIVELTGSMDIYNDILARKPRHVRAIAHTTAVLFREIESASSLFIQTNQELNETQTICKAMINGPILDDVMVISTDYRIINMNETYLKKLGLKRRDVVGRFCYEITHHKDKPCSGEKHPCPVDQVKKTGKPSTTTHTHIIQDGQKQFVSMACYPLMEDGELTGVIEVSKDVTKDVEFEKKMMHQEKMVSIGRLSAGVAHEINNPLTTILTSAMLIQEDVAPDSDIHKELSIIGNEALRCRKIVKSLLDFARQSKAFTKMESINAVIQESMVLTRKQAKFKDISLKADLAKNLPDLSIDRDQIQQTIINLTLNAIEATPTGGQIQISSRQTHSHIEIRVADTGQGIPADHLGKIFDPFFTTKENGTGLGLAITHGIIEQHGGTITAESTVGKGTAFIVLFPVPGEETK
jgi:PAS domain S-box-containing protein